MDLGLIFDNPVFTRELRRRMRGRALVVTMILYVAVMCAIAYIIITQMSGEWRAQQAHGGPRYAHYSPFTALSDIGKWIYYAITWVQAVLVLVIAPAITGAMVKAEKDKETFEFLRATAMRPAVYVTGALLSTVLYVALALLCALPVVMLAYLYGGVSDVVPSTVMLLSVSLLLSSAGLMVSCLYEKTKARQETVLLMVLVLIFGLLGGGFAIGAGRSLLQPGAGLTVGGVNVPAWAVFAIACLLVSGALVLVAGRKIFTPGERALSYSQFGLVFVLALAGLCWWLAESLGASGSNGDDFSTLLAFVFALLCILMQNIMVLNRPEIGNERWALKMRHTWLRRVDESLLYCLALTCVGGVICWGFPYLFAPTKPALQAGVGLVGLYLAGRGAMCKLAARRCENPATALKTVTVIDAVWLLGALLVLTFPEIPHLGADNQLAGQLSPVAAYLSLVGKDEWSGLLTTGSVAAVLAILATVVPTRRDTGQPAYDVPMRGAGANEAGRGSADRPS